MKKPVIFVLAAIVAAVIAALIIFICVSGGSDPEKSSGEQNEIDLTGVWKVCSSIAGETVNIPENEFMVFSGKEASLYQDGSAEPAVTSSYSIDATKHLVFPDASKTYALETNTENYILLAESPTVYMHLVRYPNADMSETTVDPSKVTGRWDVAFRKTAEMIANEYLVFENGKMSDYRNGDTKPVMELEYVWEDFGMKVASLGRTWKAYPIKEGVIALVETDTGIVWELHQAK